MTPHTLAQPATARIPNTLARTHFRAASSETPAPRTSPLHFLRAELIRLRESLLWERKMRTPAVPECANPPAEPLLRYRHLTVEEPLAERRRLLRHS